MAFETVMISAISFGIFAVATLLAGHFTWVRNHVQRRTALLPVNRAGSVAKLYRDRLRERKGLS